MVNRALNWFIYAWGALAVLVNAAALAGLFGEAHSLWGGWQRVTEISGPYNLTSWFAEIVLISPAVAAQLLLERRKKRARGARQVMSPQEAQRIIHAYAAATEKPAHWPRNLYSGPTSKDPAVRQMIDNMNAALSTGSSLRDLRTLPYTKDRIKEALLVGIAMTAGEDRLLRTDYVLLGDWQDPSVPDPMAAMLAEGKALLAELKAFEEGLKESQVPQSV